MTVKTNAQLDLEYKLKLFEFLTTVKPEQDNRFLKAHWKHEDEYWFDEHKPRIMRLRPVRAGEYRPSLKARLETQPTHVIARKAGPTALEKMFITLTRTEKMAYCDDVVLYALWQSAMRGDKDHIDMEEFISARTETGAPQSGEVQ